MVLFSEVKEKYDIIQLKDLIQQHVDATGSEKEEKGMSSDQAQIEAFYQIINGKQ